MAPQSRDDESMFAYAATVISDSKKAVAIPYVEDLTNYETCPECKECPANIIEEYSSGDMVCGSCGFCLPGRIVCQAMEWRHFSGENDANHDDPSRIGAAANPLLHGSQLQTSIGSSSSSLLAAAANNSTSKHGTTARTRTLQRAQEATMAVDANDKSNKKLQTRYSEISALCEGMALTRDIVNTAQYYYKLVNDAKYLRGYKPIAVIAGCVFIACRTCHVPRTFQEVFSCTNVPKADIGKIFKLLQKFLSQPARKKLEEVIEAGGMFPALFIDFAFYFFLHCFCLFYFIFFFRLTPDNKTGTIPTPSSSTSPTTSTKTQSSSSLALLPRFSSHLQLPYKCESLASAICTASVTVIPTLGSRHPASIAAVAIFMASLLLKEKRALKDVSIAAGTGIQTIRLLYKIFWGAKEAFLEAAAAEGNFDPGKDLGVERLPVP